MNIYDYRVINFNFNYCNVKLLIKKWAACAVGIVYIEDSKIKGAMHF